MVYEKYFTGIYSFEGLEILCMTQKIKDIFL